MNLQIIVRVSESYIVLSRKYRPKGLGDLIGQEVLVKSLRTCIETQKIPHAFLFHGIRGVGKTTSARILSRCLSCVERQNGGGATSSPCGTCRSCVAIDRDSHMDIMEFDAASKTGVEDIREILEASQYTPILGRYKIFIIDEVHMLSKSAFNALLKTLEEPPKHVKFIFATTELHKVPETVLSRCMTFQLRPVTEEALNHHLIKIADLEGFTLEVEAAAIMTEESEGSVRDALSMLEQATMLAHDSKAITADMILSMLGSARQSDINQLLNLVIDAKTQEALEYTEKILKSGCEPMALHKHLQKELYKTIAERVSNKNDLKLSNLLYLWQILLKQTENIKNSAAPDNILKAAVIVLAHTSQFQCIEDLMIYGDNLRESPNEKSNKPSDTGNSLINNVLKKFPGSIASEVE